MEKLTTLFRKPIEVEEAILQIKKVTALIKTETVPLIEANGRILAEDVRATKDIPAFDRSPYDGFAVRSEDLKQASRENKITLPIQYVQGAGHIGAQLLPQHTIRIMTGAKIPAGADAIVMLEVVTANEMSVTFKRPVLQTNISYQGEDIAYGDEILTCGTSLNPGNVALLATFGYKQVHVYKKPHITVFATGDELVEPGYKMAEGQIYNSNAYMLLSQIENLGAKATYGGILPDTFEGTKSAIEKAISISDAIVTTGGVSVGDFDYLPDVYDAIKANVLFNKVGMRPGSVTTVAHVQDCLLFGLSGNPSACFVGAELFVGAYIRTSQLRSDRTVIPATLGMNFPKANPFDRFVRGRLTINANGKAIIYPSGKDKSGIVSSLSTCNALIQLPGGTRGFEEGDLVSCRIIDQL